MNERMYGNALDLCQQLLDRDVAQYWTTYKSFVEELSRGQTTEGRIKVALFNDTDFRVNIGCRLTSQGLKRSILRAFPDAAVTSASFDFAAFRKEFSSSIVHRPKATELEERLLAAYGETALDTIAGSDFILLQPEGSLDDETSPEGLATFFTPVLVAQRLGKPYAVLNGTIPIYRDERDDYLHRLFKSLRFVAARDEFSATHYDVTFLPDAAFLRIAPDDVVHRDGCLITTGARNRAEDDIEIFKSALAVCDSHSLRPVVLTRAADHFAAFEREVISRGGIFAETASIEMAADIISRCRLHIGGRYHMAIFSTLCRVPTLLFDVRTHKNQWLAQYSPLIRLVDPKSDIMSMAGSLLDDDSPARPHPPHDYEGFLKHAYSLGTAPASVLKTG
ncbi:polysaccharide pyruvyl transferase family protein [Rhizobium sp. ARZ01]|nr:polysaccharide pyruvyl transferase family protein [Rhizobium sp. ARZ01]